VSLLINPYRYASGVTLPSDTFNRADGALGTSSSGHAWTHTGWTVGTNQCVPPNSGGASFATVDAGAANVTVAATLDPALSPDWGLVVRYVDAGNLILFDIVHEVDHWICRVFQKVAGGAFTGLTTLVNPVVTLGADHDTPFTAAITVTGDAGEAFINGISQGAFSAVDAALLSATSHGLYGNDVAASRFDNFVITAA
jgi:hypothetical protein